jgi:hypothetical protein
MKDRLLFCDQATNRLIYGAAAERPANQSCAGRPILCRSTNLLSCCRATDQTFAGQPMLGQTKRRRATDQSCAGRPVDTSWDRPSDQPVELMPSNRPILTDLSSCCRVADRSSAEREIDRSIADCSIDCCQASCAESECRQ